LEDAWAGRGTSGDQYRDASHIYSEDLDVFGKGSLFELIARTRTNAGEELLARWFLTPADREEALARQAAVNELRSRLDLREDIALIGEDIRSGVKAHSLIAWGTAPETRFAPFLRPLCLLLAIAGIVFLIAFFASLLPIWPLIAVLACNFTLIFLLRHRVSNILAGVDSSGRDLTIISLMLERFEGERFECLRLQELRSVLDIRGLTASRRIAKLGRLIEILDSSDHVLVRAIRPLVLWNEQLAMALERWRRDSGRSIGSWVRTIAEFEALSSLASIAFERPGWTFACLSESAPGLFRAEGLQHPLLSTAECVPNDVSMDDSVRLLIVSGSNMSGKSTLLRSVGLNAVLAWAGAPVAAARLEISRLQVGASIRITDSLQEHRSRFFAEIVRIRQIVELTRTGPLVLFLLDELLSGTNSHDRRIGAAGIVKGLLDTNAIGLLTTHDLALTKIEPDEPRVMNVHFEDRMSAGQIEFDYKLRPGVVQRSNALELMRAVGLQV
jgi:DNA mismatch repair ATPase MutS